jgi:hypothetical protein
MSGAPGPLVQRWEAAYRRYTTESEHVRFATDPSQVAAAMASASWEVATAWRDIATSTALPWWTLAAVRAAADAFEAQAHTWQITATEAAANTGGGGRKHR